MGPQISAIAIIVTSSTGQNTMEWGLVGLGLSIEFQFIIQK